MGEFMTRNAPLGWYIACIVTVALVGQIIQFVIDH